CLHTEITRPFEFLFGNLLVRKVANQQNLIPVLELMFPGYTYSHARGTMSSLVPGNLLEPVERALIRSNDNRLTINEHPVKAVVNSHPTQFLLFNHHAYWVDQNEAG